MSSSSHDALTHFDAEGKAHMVDVGAKSETRRVAVATGPFFMSQLKIGKRAAVFEK